MISQHQRLFCNLVILVCCRMNKVSGHLLWLAERIQFGGELEPVDIDQFYDRWYRLEDAIGRLKASDQWHSVDEVFPEEEDDD